MNPLACSTPEGNVRAMGSLLHQDPESTVLSPAMSSQGSPSQVWNVEIRLIDSALPKEPLADGLDPDDSVQVGFRPSLATRVGLTSSRDSRRSPSSWWIRWIPSPRVWSPWSAPCSDSRRSHLKVWAAGSLRRGSEFRWVLAARFGVNRRPSPQLSFRRNFPEAGDLVGPSNACWAPVEPYLSARLGCLCPMDAATPPRLHPEGRRLGYPPSTPHKEVSQPARSGACPEGPASNGLGISINAPRSGVGDARCGFRP